MRPSFLLFFICCLWLPSLADESCSLIQVRKQQTITTFPTLAEIPLAEIDGQLELPGLQGIDPFQAKLSNEAYGFSLLQWIPQTSHVSSWMLAGSISAVVALGLLFVLAGVFCTRLPRAMVSISVIAVYITLSVSIDLLILYQKQSEGEGSSSVYKFDPTCSIILTEFIKLVFSLSLYTTNQVIAGNQWLPQTLTLSDVSLFTLPALFFTANNIMVFVAIGGNDASAFGVFRDTMILWTALIWKYVFGSSLGPTRLFGIGIIFIGLVVNRLGSISGATFSWAFLLVMLMTVTNATGSVFNEYALKWNQGLDINMQNAVLYAMCIVFSIVILAVRSPVHLTSLGAFFEGFTNWTILMVCLQASAGLLVSRLLKYADSVYKTIGTCLRGPTLVLTAPFVIGSQKDVVSIISAFIVASGCLTYLTQGPLSAASGKAESMKNDEGTVPETAAEKGDTK